MHQPYVSVSYDNRQIPLSIADRDFSSTPIDGFGSTQRMYDPSDTKHTRAICIYTPHSESSESILYVALPSTEGADVLLLRSHDGIHYGGPRFSTKQDTIFGSSGLESRLREVLVASKREPCGDALATLQYAS